MAITCGDTVPHGFSGGALVHADVPVCLGLAQAGGGDLRHATVIPADVVLAFLRRAGVADSTPDPAVEPARAKLCWLHFADLDIDASGAPPDWQDGLQRNLETLAEAGAGPVDLVMLSGGLRDGGEAAAAKLAQWLEQLEALLSASGTTPQFLAVPAASDYGALSVSAGKAKRRLLRDLRHWNDDEDVRSDFFADDEDDARPWFDAVLAPWTAALRDRRWPPLQPGALAGDFAATVEVGGEGAGGYRVGVVGLNTAFLALADPALRALEPAQMHAACGDVGAWLARHHAAILLTHEAPAALHDAARQRFEAGVAPPGRFVVHLCGGQADRDLSGREGEVEPRRLW